MAHRITDKFFLLACSAMLYYFTLSQHLLFMLIPVLLVLVLCSVGTIFQNIYLHLAIYLIYLGVCCFFPLFMIFIPVVLYELQYTAFRWISIFAILPFVLFRDSFSPIVISFTILFFSLSIFLYFKTSRIELLQDDYEAFRKTARELSLVQEEKNKSILDNQDYEIQTATLNERNRISKEIHDHVGHLLSRSLLQIGALLTFSKDPAVRAALTELKSSLSEGMDTIRASIHNMHDESIDLEWAVNDLVRGFTYCSVQYDYNLHSSLPLKLKYCFIAVIKESLANIIKHGNEVTLVILKLSETDQHYCLYLCDNGSVSEKTTWMILRCQARSEFPEGLGLQSISDRVRGLNGKFFIQTAKGFELTITIPKEDNTYETLTH